MKQIITYTFLLFLILGSFSVFALEYVKTDEKGNQYFKCEGSSDRALSIKIIDTNVYKVLAPYVGKIVHAKSESEAAQIICQESAKAKAAK